MTTLTTVDETQTTNHTQSDLDITDFASDPSVTQLPPSMNQMTRLESDSVVDPHKTTSRPPPSKHTHTHRIPNFAHSKRGQTSKDLLASIADFRMHTDAEENIAIFVALNALLQFVGDVILESLHLIPTRINHLSLTFLNAFLGFKTLSAIHKKQFKFLHEDVQVLLLMEICLVLGDIYYLIRDDFNLTFFWFRLAFIFLSTFNTVYVLVIIVKYKLYHLTYQGDGANGAGGDSDELTPLSSVKASVAAPPSISVATTTPSTTG